MLLPNRQWRGWRTQVWEGLAAALCGFCTENREKSGMPHFFLTRSRTSVFAAVRVEHCEGRHPPDPNPKSGEFQRRRIKLLSAVGLGRCGCSPKDRKGLPTRSQMGASGSTGAGQR
eukprot:EG_transcript_11701